MPDTTPIVVASNRGPVTFELDDQGSLVARRGAGGLVSGLVPLATESHALWIAAAGSDADRLAAGHGAIDAGESRIRMIAIDAEQYRMAYDVVGNSTLWFLHHGLWDLARRPRFDRYWYEAWDAYRAYNDAFTSVMIDETPNGSIVLVQDYHLCLVAPRLREARPDLRLVHFTHTPFAGPDLVRVLPSGVRRELLAGLNAHHACGFHTGRWARRFEESCHEVLDSEPTRAFASPLAADAAHISATAASEEVSGELSALEDRIGDRMLITRVDRIELSKNLVRGFIAFEALLEQRPQWRERVVFGAFVYPSREGLPEYLSYRTEVENLIWRINDRWGTRDWTPILYDSSDSYPRSIAALKRYDLLLVNPIRDGLNLVAKEGPIVNERDGVLLLSTEAGAWDELSGQALAIDPFDIVDTTHQLDMALAMPPDERRRRAVALRAKVLSRSPADWLADQVREAGTGG